MASVSSSGCQRSEPEIERHIHLTEGDLVCFECYCIHVAGEALSVLCLGRRKTLADTIVIICFLFFTLYHSVFTRCITQPWMVIGFFLALQWRLFLTFNSHHFSCYLTCLKAHNGNNCHSHFEWQWLNQRWSHGSSSPHLIWRELIVKSIDFSSTGSVLCKTVSIVC